MEPIISILSDLREEIYDRQLKSSLIDNFVQEKIEELRVLIPGCGALGSVISEMLVRLGVRKLRIVDFDFVEPSNYPRTGSIGLFDSLSRIPKVVACESFLRRINPFVEIESVYGWVSPLNSESLVDGMDIVMDGLDNLKTRSFIAKAAWSKGIPYVYSGVSDHYYNVVPLIPGKTTCFDCLFTVPKKEEGGIPVLVSTVYSAAAIAVMVLLQVIRDAVESVMVIGDLFNFSIDKIPVSVDGCNCNVETSGKGTCVLEEMIDKQVLFTSGIDLGVLEDSLKQDCIIVNRDKWILSMLCGSDVISIYRDDTIACENGDCKERLNIIAGRLGCNL
ncbi:MAG: ThiF family adenylyltransferase [Desulfurococcales archaeon]|nr:ThiF family adenylyltransferase [Desulfurococcales archaeon]